MSIYTTAKVTMASATAAALYSSSLSVVVVVLVGLLLAGGHTKVTANVLYIVPVCKTIGGGSNYFDVQICLGALGSDARSAGADMDYHTYAIIAADLLTANATSTAAKIAGLIPREAGGGGRDYDDDATVRGLRSCQALYAGIVQRQPSCAAAIKDGRNDEAVSSLERSASAAKECEDGFVRNNAPSPVTAEDDNAFKLGKIVVALIKVTDFL